IVTILGLLPLYLIKQQTLGITAKQLNQRMSSERLPIELSDLIVALNQMLERLDNSFKRLSEFSNDIAHELRTPVTNLLTQTQVAISRPRDSDTYQNILASNAEELQQLSKMIADMLFLAKAEHGFELPSNSDIDLATEIHALFEFYEALAEEQKISLQLSGTGNIVGDRLMIRRAINNLLSNAILHTPVNSVIQFSIDSTENELSLKVQNPGVTILAADIPYLFERFYRSNKTRSRHNTEGTGLGLAITQAIVKAHNGEISVASEAGMTCFTIVFNRKSIV
ncbi:MAG: heavy metal sensor histidine kinase, partial [Pseudomonadales bacterium]|nr:heavy metal sensor histidine kinase [Pseudomonadales bacterium]